MLGRGAGDHGEFVCKVGVEDGFQREARKAAGGGMAAVCFGLKSACLIWSKIEQAENIRRSACLKEEVWEKVEGYRLTGGTGFGRKWPLVPATPVRNFAGLAALFGEGAEGKWRGGVGLL
jgi:hypothetical protein